ncbi:MAG: DUF4080 domain-containing protein, partial [Defluviitaleaceae bacterium]|nr:DUF4080 domain-containing protein [Defluviitaleaceae bacterium]
AAGEPFDPNIHYPSEIIDPFTDACMDAIKGRIVYLETSRGCPFSCAYCLSGDSAVQFFPMDIAKNQIEKLSKADVRVIKFVDRTFNADRERAYELFEFIINLDTANRFHFEVGADLFDERTLELLATAPVGRMQFEAGLQSFFKPALDASARYMDLQKAMENICTILNNGNIHIHLDLIAGLPHETLGDFENSFNQTYAAQPHKLQLGFLKLLHGSALRKNFKEILHDAAPPYEIKSSPWMSAADLKILKQTEDALQNTYNKGHFLSTLKYVLNASKMSPFEFYRALGQRVKKDGMALDAYTERIFDFCIRLDGTTRESLLENMICDWLGMVKGSNMPAFMKLYDKKQLSEIIKTAEQKLGRKIRRNQAAVLPCGKGIFVDSESRDPITNLYNLHFVATNT